MLKEKNNNKNTKKAKSNAKNNAKNNNAKLNNVLNLYALNAEKNFKEKHNNKILNDIII